MDLTHAKTDFDEDYIKLQLCDLCKAPLALSGGLQYTQERGRYLDVDFRGERGIDYRNACEECYKAFASKWHEFKDLETKLANSRHPFNEAKKKDTKAKPKKLFGFLTAEVN